ncbi:hypothetical protein JTE90_017633 [Oedothorax gibbosus]|uniref:FLYWCH-type domain-containing protein n=1 Tax=Oedothorax gibbosus TaxID=931172 RepID=A0AAV6U8F2_9ARAC|nr:hypothetical protein JTE90_017633 [Oedothorax gibbosus]
MEQAVFLQGRAKDGKCLLRDGYLFRIGKRTPKKSYYTCLVSKCLSTVALDLDEKMVLSSNGIEHNHAANPAEIEVRKFHQKLRQNILDQPNTAIPQLYKETLSSIHASSEVLSQIPTFTGIKNYMYKVRASVRHPLPKTMEEQQLDGICSKTTDGSDFLMVDEGIGDNRIMKRKQLKCSASAQTLEGTFTIIKGHNHVILPEEISAAKLRGEMKKKAEYSDSRPAAIFNSVVRTADKAIYTLLPSEDSCKRTIRNQRSKKFPKHPENLDSLDKAKKKPGASAAATKPSQPTFESEVVIKDEPIDIDESPVPSTSRTDPESILLCTDSFQSGIPVLPCKDPISSTSGTDIEFITPCTDSFQSGTTPTVGEAFTTVMKTEPVDEDEQQTNSNGNTRKASKRKAVDMADVLQSGSPSNEDSATKNNNAKDHAFQCTIGEVYSLVKSGQVLEQQQVVQKPHWYKTSNGTKTQSSQKQTFVAVQSLPVEDVSLTSENESAKSHLDDYGKYIAGELKMLDSKSCAHVQRVIADLLFDAKLGKFK